MMNQIVKLVNEKFYIVFTNLEGFNPTSNLSLYQSYSWINY